MRRAALLLATLTLPAHAEIAVSANDGKQVLADGAQIVPSPLVRDSVSILEFGGGKLRIVATVAAAASVIGPPRSVAITPDGAYAIVTCARRVRTDGRDIEPDDVVSVIDIHAAKVVATLHAGAGAGASGVAIAPDGRRVLIANRAAGTVSMFDFAHGKLAPRATLALGPATSPAQPIFYAGGTRALVTRDGDSRISIVSVSDTGLALLPRALAAGLRPYGIDVTGDRTRAVVANIGGGGRDVDTISLIDLSAAEPIVRDTVAVGLTPEGIKMSPDAQFVAVSVNNGSNNPHASPTYAPHGLLQVWRVVGDRLRKVAEVPSGGWGQGMVWSHDGRQILFQAMIGATIQSYGFDGQRLTPGPSITMPAGPAAIASVEP